jgi:hypothetical protein
MSKNENNMNSASNIQTKGTKTMDASKLKLVDVESKINKLADDIKAQLKEHDEKIITVLKSNYQMGKELKAIQELLEKSEIDVATYAEVKFDIAHSQCYRLIEMVKIRANIGETDETVFISERATRPLTDFDPADQKAIWEKAKAAANGKIPTGTQVEAASEGFSKKDKRNYTVKTGSEFFSRVLQRKVDLTTQNVKDLIKECKSSEKAIRLVSELYPHETKLRERKDSIISLIQNKVKSEIESILK